jgi:hypothetical protein
MVLAAGLLGIVLVGMNALILVTIDMVWRLRAEDWARRTRYRREYIRDLYHTSTDDH